MADGECNNSAQNDVVELEAMRKGTFSWHPCQIALCSRGLGLVVLYGDCKFEETIKDKQEIFERLRVRSIPLQGDDCSFIKQGEHVLATKSSRAKSVFSDARVEEAFHVRHSKRIHCRCSFRIKWLNKINEEEASTVPSSSIMKLSTKGIHLHPTISTFLSMMETPNGLDETPCPMIVDGMNSEMDITVLLEKQIKAISNLTDISRETISMDFGFEQVGFKGQRNDLINESSLRNPSVMLPFLDISKGSNGRENKQHKEVTVEIPPVCISSPIEEEMGSRFLSPLAARAALASLRSEFPQNPLKISATSEGKGLVKELFPTSNAPEVEVSNLSSGAKVNEMDKRKRIREKKISQPSHSRSTRAQAQKTNGQNEATEMTNTNGIPSTVGRARRVTRSTVEEAEKIEVKEYNATVDLQNGTSTADDPQNDTFVQNAENQSYPKRLTRSAARGGAEKDILQSDIKKGSFVQDSEKQNYPKKLTRSLSQAESEKINAQPKQKLRKNNYPESYEVNLFREDVIVDTNTSELKSEKIFTEEREKNRKSCTRVKNTPKSSENGVGSSRSTRQKSDNSKKQDTRFSPRLRSLYQSKA